MKDLCKDQLLSQETVVGEEKGPMSVKDPPDNWPPDNLNSNSWCLLTSIALMQMVMQLSNHTTR